MPATADGVWSRIAELAAQQHGVVTRAQMRGLGATDAQITRAVATGRLHRVHRGVFAVGHPALLAAGRAAAAVLACGPRAALGYRSAGAHHGLRPWSSPRVEVVVASTSRPTHGSGVIVHRHPTLRPDEVEVLDGVRVTTVPRTLLDVAVVLSASALRSTVAQAETTQVFDLHALNAVLERHPRHRGIPALRSVLASWAEPDRTRSPQEVAFPDLCVRLGLPRPVMNAEVLGMEVDAVFFEHGVAVELDSWRHHRGILKWEDDHERRNRLIAAGWTPVAFTYRQQREAGGRQVLQTLGPALEQGRSRPAPRR